MSLPACPFLDCPTLAICLTLSTHEAYKWSKGSDNTGSYYKASNHDVITQLSVGKIAKSVIIEPQELQMMRLTVNGIEKRNRRILRVTV